MNKFELQASHMAKIFEMCNKFYPETIVIGTVIIDGIVLFKQVGRKGVVKIHWLELILTHLSVKVIFGSNKPRHFNQNTHFRLVDQMMNLFNNADKSEHPVDFLYTEFLKLNK